MPRWTLFALLPLIAAVLVFGPTLLSAPEGSRAGPLPSKIAAVVPAKTTSPLAAADPSILTTTLPSGMKIGASLGFVLLLALGGVWLVRRMQHPIGAPNGVRSIEIKESRRLGKGRAIHYLRVADHLLLIAESETGISLLRDLTPHDQDHDAMVDITGDHDGATPRDLLPPAQRRAPATGTKKAKLGDFRELLGKLA